MNIRIFKEDVLEGLQKAAGIIQNKSGIQSSRSIWLKAEENRLHIMATDFNMEFKGSYPSEVMIPGMVGVPGKDFVEIIRRAYSGSISLRLVENEAQQLRIEQKGNQGSFNCNIPISDPTWYQGLSEFPDKDKNVLWSGDFVQDIIDRISYCISENDGESISCMLIKPVDGGTIDVCGLNNHQMGIFSFIHDDLHAVLPASGILIQKKYLVELKKWIGEKEIELSLSDKRIFLRDIEHKETLSLPLSFYQYPDYCNLLARSKGDSNSKLTIDRKDIIDALERLSIFNSDSNVFTYYDLNTAKSGELSLSVKSQDKGFGTQSLHIEFTGDLNNISFPTKSMLEIFSHYRSEKVHLSMNMDHPCAINGDEDPDYTVIIMPMKVNEYVNYEEEHVQ